MTTSSVGKATLAGLSHQPLKSSSLDLFGYKPFLERLVDDLSRNSERKLVGLFAPWGCGKTSALNMCLELANDSVEDTGSPTGNDRAERLLWITPFECWRYERVADLEIALLWHIRRSIPHVRPRAGKVASGFARVMKAASLACLSVGSQAILSRDLVGDAKQILEALDANEREQSPSLIAAFAQCQAVDDVAKEFQRLGEILCKQLGCDRIVVPVDDMDRCSPEMGTRLLFSLKHLLVSDKFTFVVAVDRGAMAKFLGLTYRQSLSMEDCHWFLEKVFDEWVELPEPNVLRMFDWLCERESVTQLNNGNFRSMVLAGNLAEIMRNPRKFVRACERFLRLVDLPSQLTSGEGAWYLKFALCVLYTESPQVFDELCNWSAGNRGDLKKDDVFMQCRSFLSKIEEQLLSRPSSRRDSDSGTAIEVSRRALPPRISEALQARSSCLRSIVMWLYSDVAQKIRLRNEEMAQCLVDVRKAL